MCLSREVHLYFCREDVQLLSPKFSLTETIVEPEPEDGRSWRLFKDNKLHQSNTMKRYCWDRLIMWVKKKIRILKTVFLFLYRHTVSIWIFYNWVFQRHSTTYKFLRKSVQYTFISFFLTRVVSCPHSRDPNKYRPLWWRSSPKSISNGSGKETCLESRESPILTLFRVETSVISWVICHLRLSWTDTGIHSEETFQDLH